MRFFINGGIQLAVMIAAICINFSKGGTDLVVQGLFSTWRFTKTIGPVLVLAFLMAGQMDIIVQQYLPVIQSWVSGGKGLFHSYLAGALFPGGGFAMGPVLQDLWSKEVISKAAIIVFLLASQLNWQLFIIRLPIFGAPIMAALCLVNFGLSVVFTLLLLFFVK